MASGFVLAVCRVRVGVGESPEGLLVHGAEYLGLHSCEARPFTRERAVEVLCVQRMPLQGKITDLAR